MFLLEAITDKVLMRHPHPHAVFPSEQVEKSDRVELWVSRPEEPGPEYEFRLMQGAEQISRRIVESM